LIKLINLKPASAGYLWKGKFKPYVRFSIGSNQVRRTQIQKGTTNPVFTESFSFLVHSLADEVLHVKASESHKYATNQVLGIVNIPLQEFEEANGPKIIEQEYSLEGETISDAKVYFRMLYSPSSYGK